MTAIYEETMPVKSDLSLERAILLGFGGLDRILECL